MKIDEFRLSKIILSARKRMNLTQNEVSKTTGITQGTLSKIESYQCSVSAKHWFLLSKLLDIPSTSVWTGYIDRGIRPSTPSTKNVFKQPKKYFNHSYSSTKEIAPIIKFICEKIGKERLDQYLAKLKMTDLIFIDLNNKISFQLAYDLLKEVFSEGITQDDFKKIAQYSKDLNLHGAQAEVYKKKKSSIALLKSFLENSPFYQEAYKYNILSKTDNNMTFELEPLQATLPEFNKVKDILIPYTKAYLESFISNNSNEKTIIEIEENINSDKVLFSVRVESI